MNCADFASQNLPGRSEWQTSAGIGRHAAELARNLNADEGALERYAGTVPVNVGGSGGKPLLCAGLRSFRALEVNFSGQLGSFREDGHAIRQDLREAANDSKRRRPLRCALKRQFADAQFG